MSLKFLPSYLRNWIDAEWNSPEKDVPFDFQETTDETEDWVVINYRKTTNEQNDDELDDMLSQYVFIKTHAPPENETENKNKISKTDNCREKSTEYLANASSGTRKRAKRRIYGPNKMRSTVASLKARRYSPGVGYMPYHFPKIAIERIELPTAERIISSSQLSFRSPIKAEERLVESRIVPYDGNKCAGQTISASEILEVFHQLAKTSCTTVVHCDHSLQSNHLLAIPDRFSVKYNTSYAATPIYEVDNAYNLDAYNLDDIFTTIKPTKQLRLESLVQLYVVNKSTLKDSCNYSPFLKTACDDVILEDYREQSSKVFSIDHCAESLYARLCSTKTKFEDLLRSIMVLHFIFNQKLESWKSISTNMFRNFSQFTNLSSMTTPSSASTMIAQPQCDIKLPSFATTWPEKSRTDWPHVATKQLRRQNRCAIRNNPTTCSNRQRGMKRGRFQNNVGQRESWRC